MTLNRGIEGGIDIDLIQQNGQVDKVSITSTRPLQTPAIFIGKSIWQVLTTLPLLYSVCGTAQAMAAVSASERALGRDILPLTSVSRQLLVMFEAAKEHLWRMQLDWPVFMAKDADHSTVAQIVKLQGTLNGLLNAEKKLFLAGYDTDELPAIEITEIIDNLELLLSEKVFRVTCNEWSLIEDERSLSAWATETESIAGEMVRWVYNQGWTQLGNNDVGFLPELEADFLESQFTDELSAQFIAAPEVGKRCYETTSLARQANQELITNLIGEFGNGVLVRLAARLYELADLPGQMRAVLSSAEENCSTHTLGEGIGLSEVEAARGRLIHRVELDDNTVKRYQILAPTEWNFHPDGVLANSLKALKAGSSAELEQQARLMINAIDPCVGYELTIT